MSLEEIKPEVPDPPKQVTEQPTETPVYRVFSESMSDNINELAGALALAQGEMNNAPKSKQGYGYKYAPIDVITDIVRPALSKNKLALIQTHELIRGTSPSMVTHTTLMHTSGQYHKSSIELPLQPMKQLSASQVAGIGMSYGRRYALQSLFLIAAEEDIDGNAK